MERRAFVKLCTGMAAVLAANPARLSAQSAEAKSYERVKLVDSSGKAVSVKTLEKQVSYVFQYPYKGTPSVLLNLGSPLAGGAELKTAQGEAYHWAGGVGPDKSVVAYVSICTHQLAYPTKSQSFINFQKGKSEFAGKPDLITCCLHNSAFDPAEGGKVVMGPAPQPLPTIVLDYDAKEDALYATGVLGAGEVFEDFFRAFKSDLREQFGRGVANQEQSGSATLLPLKEYTAQQAFC
jgi:arsenite oxidase small subunit